MKIKKKIKRQERYYIPEDTIKGEKRLIPFNEVKRIEKKLDTICKILKEDGVHDTFEIIFKR